ncbi:MAG: hypothetical protein KKA79_09580 [Nanoarchaeota archaeon]|nr:hypothetical protein [Nanoarchaeota archaeon]
MNLQEIVGKYKVMDENGSHSLESYLGTNEYPYIRSTPENPNFGTTGTTTGGGPGSGSGSDGGPFGDISAFDIITVLMLSLLAAYIFSKIWNKIMPDAKTYDAREALKKQKGYNQLEVDEDLENPWKDHKKIYYGGKKNGKI